MCVQFVKMIQFISESKRQELLNYSFELRGLPNLFSVCVFLGWLSLLRFISLDL